MKLKITDVMICEWDAETKCMIVSPAEGWKVNVNYPISEAHASMVMMEKMDGPDIIDLKSLTGMWVKCTTEDDGIRLYKEGSWYQIGSDYWMGSCWNTYGASEIFDLTDARDYNPDELIGKYYKGDEITSVQLLPKGEGVSFIMDGMLRIVDGDFNLSDVTDEPKPERKPHQLKEYDAVECTPEERAEIIRIADECGVPVYIGTRDPESIEDFPNLHFTGREFTGLVRKDQCVKTCWKWHTVPDFIAKIRGEYTAVNVTEHKHESV